MTWKYITKLTPSGTSGANFTNIPQTYKDIAVIWYSRLTGSGGTSSELRCIPNYTGGQGASFKGLGNSIQNNGITSQLSAANQLFVDVGWQSGSNNSSGRYGAGMTYIPNYTTAQSGSMLCFSTNLRVSTDSTLGNISGFYYGGIGPITSLRFTNSAGYNYDGNTVLYLYGIN